MNSTKVLKLQNSYTFSTSGTCGPTRRYSHSRSTILREISYLATLGAPCRLLSFVSPQHLYGYLWTVLLPTQWKIECLDLRVSGARQIERTLRPGDWIIGHPGLWERLALTRWPDDCAAINSGGPPSPAFPGELLARGLGTWLDIYGSTEIGGIGMRRGLDSDFELFPYWPDFMQDIDRQDELLWQSPRCFRLGHRLDGLVSVSGRNVDPNAVALKMAGCPGVQQIAVRLMRPEEGRRLKAFVVGTATIADLETFAQQHLESWQRPAYYTMGATLPISDRGKHRDWE